MTYEYECANAPDLDAIIAGVAASAMADKALLYLKYCGECHILWATFSDALAPNDRSIMQSIVEANS